jgi:hypothetical protein
MHDVQVLCAWRHPVCHTAAYTRCTRYGAPLQCPHTTDGRHHVLQFSFEASHAFWQAISAALPILREALPAPVRVGAYGNGFFRTTSEWLHEQRADGTAQPPQLDRDQGTPSRPC